ncbi:protease B [Flavobacteriaceae bacterium R38]|nr:protease B [Flavobacteriaceae bacterium R38]
MKKSKFSLLLSAAFLTTTMFVSCTSDNAEDGIVNNEEFAAVELQLRAAGFDTSDLEATTMNGVSGYAVEGDIFLTVEQINDISPQLSVENGDVANTEHYRTTNLVSSPRAVSVYMDTAFPAITQTAFDEALARYNALNLELVFQRANGPGADIDILAERLPRNILGRSAGFPDAAGNPASPIVLNNRIYAPRGRNGSIPADAVTVIAHEIGHAIGFRHTDFFDRSFSCGGSAVNEGDGGVGAIFIPGTPAGPEAGSFMLACSNGTDRPFTSGDQTALNTLY